LLRLEHEKKAHSEEAWMKTVMKSGTVTDKLAAITLLIQAAPLFRIKHVDTLLGMATKKNRREAVMAIDTLKDLFTTNLLPSDRKLMYAHFRRPFFVAIRG
jgi:ribosome biogenesis protein MAK21